SSERQPTGSSLPCASASASALFGEIGPPRNTTGGPDASGGQGSSTWASGISVGRLSTTPSVPSSRSSSPIKTTVRRKLGSPSSGVAASRRPLRDCSSIAQSCASKLTGGTAAPDNAWQRPDG